MGGRGGLCVAGRGRVGKGTVMPRQPRPSRQLDGFY